MSRLPAVVGRSVQTLCLYRVHAAIRSISLRYIPMKSHTEYLTFNIPARMDFLNITSQVAEILQRSGIREGLLLCNAMHITASVFINDDESGLHGDYKKWLEQ